MSRYRLLPVGIFDTLLNREIQPGEDAWREYQIALLGGDSPDPMQASAPDLEAVRAERLAEVNLRRQAALAGGVRFGDHVYDSDPASRANITGVVTANDGGAAIAGAAMPTGGSGISGWLSAIWARASAPLSTPSSARR